jgi:hypothetical protein
MSRQLVNTRPQITDRLVKEGRLGPTRDKREGDAKTGNRTRRSEVIPYRAPTVGHLSRSSKEKGVGIKQGNRPSLSSAGVWADLSGMGGRRRRRQGVSQIQLRKVSHCYKTKIDRVRVNPFL